MIGKKIGAALVAMALCLVTAMPGASATESQNRGHNDITEGLVETDLFYGNFENGFVLFTSLTPEDYCIGTPSTTAPARVFARHDGTLKLKTRPIRGVELFLYQFNGDAIDLIDMTCEAIFDEDPSTEPPRPIATGIGWLRITLTGLDSIDAPGGFHVANFAKGKVRSADGRRWKLFGRANFDLDDDGFPIGEPANFQSLSVREL